MSLKGLSEVNHTHGGIGNEEGRVQWCAGGRDPKSKNPRKGNRRIKALCQSLPPRHLQPDADLPSSSIASSSSRCSSCSCSSSRRRGGGLTQVDCRIVRDAREPKRLGQVDDRFLVQEGVARGGPFGQAVFLAGLLLMREVCVCGEGGEEGGREGGGKGRGGGQGLAHADVPRGRPAWCCWACI